LFHPTDPALGNRPRSLNKNWKQWW